MNMFENFLDPNSGVYYTNLTMLIIGPLAVLVIAIGFYFIFFHGRKKPDRYELKEPSKRDQMVFPEGHIIGTGKYKRHFEPDQRPRFVDEMPKGEMIAHNLRDGTAMPVRETDGGKLWAKIESNECPDCGGRGFYEGPSGGMSVNISCASGCGARFNVTPMVGTAERI